MTDYIQLAKHERVIAVVPEYVRGPGWSNEVVWVYVHNTAGNSIRTECIQIPGRTTAMHVLFAAGAAMCGALRDAVPIKRAREEPQP